MPNENDNGSIIAESLKSIYSYSTLEMLYRSPYQGYNVPFTGFRIGRAPSASEIRLQRWMAKRGVLRYRSTMERLTPMFERRYAAAAARHGAGAMLSTSSKAALAGVGSRFLVGQAAKWALRAAYVGWAIDIIQLGVGGYNALSRMASKAKYLELGGYFPETQGAVTSRQRAVQAITASQLQARSAIGNEAMLFHR